MPRHLSPRRAFTQKGFSLRASGWVSGCEVDNKCPSMLLIETHLKSQDLTKNPTLTTCGSGKPNLPFLPSNKAVLFLPVISAPKQV